MRYKNKILNELPPFPLQSENLEEYENLRTHYALHNIKNAVKNMDWVLEGDINEETRGTLKDHIKHIFETLDDFDTLSRIREKQEFSMAELESLFSKLIRPSLKSKGTKFTWLYEDTLPISLQFHQPLYHVFQVFNNLITNAQKAVENVESKEITIFVSQWDSQTALFKVCDKGIGIPPENRSKVFELKFSTTGSTGIGLTYISNELQKMGGNIQLASTKPPFSTIFEVKLPTNKP